MSDDESRPVLHTNRQDAIEQGIDNRELEESGRHGQIRDTRGNRGDAV